MAPDVGVETAGVFAEFAQLGEHALDQLLQRVAGLVALVAQHALALARVGQQVAGGAHAAHAQALGQPGLQQFALAAGPAVVLGQLGQALRQFDAQLAQFVEQVLAVRQQPARTLAQVAGMAHQLRRGAGVGHLQRQLLQCL